MKKKVATKEPPSESKWRRRIAQISHATMADDDTQDYKKTLEYRKSNFKVLFGTKRDESSDGSRERNDNLIASFETV